MICTKASSVITGPKIAIPRAILSRTSSCDVELNAKRAKAHAFDKSINSRKKGSASLKKREITKQTINTHNNN